MIKVRNGRNFDILYTFEFIECEDFVNFNSKLEQPSLFIQDYQAEEY
jgi:hypothetical protein